MRRNRSDAPSKLRFCSRPYFGFVVGSLPGRVFQNSFNIFSRPRHALKPPLINFLVRWRAQKLRPLQTKVLFSAVLLKVGGLPGRISQNSSDIFLPPRHVLKPPLVCLLIRQQFCAQWPLQKLAKPQKGHYFRAGLYIYSYLYWCIYTFILTKKI